MTTETKHTELAEFVASLGLVYTAEFVPMSQARERDAHGLNWGITIKRGRSTLTTPYFQGIAHVPGYKHDLFCRSLTLAQAEERDALLRACETGKAGGRWLPSLGVRVGTKPIPAPALLDVLFCLVSDASAIDSPTYEDWAAEYGYDKDSREGEKTYRQCLEIGLKLRNMLGDESISKLRDLFSDY